MEDQFEDLDENVVDKFSKKQCRTIRHNGDGISYFIALFLNCVTVLAASPFKLVGSWVFIAAFLVSLISSYFFMNNYKSYSVFEFEELYFFVKKKSVVQKQTLLGLKEHNPVKYYLKIMSFFKRYFQGVHFSFKMHKKV